VERSSPPPPQRVEPPQIGEAASQADTVPCSPLPTAESMDVEVEAPVVDEGALAAPAIEEPPVVVVVEGVPEEAEGGSIDILDVP